jgi:hypothetical protein
VRQRVDAAERNLGLDVGQLVHDAVQTVLRGHARSVFRQPCADGYIGTSM